VRQFLSASLVIQPALETEDTYPRETRSLVLLKEKTWIVNVLACPPAAMFTFTSLRVPVLEFVQV
jgi:hypothetical protein